MFGRKPNHGQMEEQFRKLGAKMDQLIEKGKKDYPKQVAILQEKAGIAKKKLARLRGSGDEALGDLKVGAEKAVKELQSAWKSASGKFK